jgi:hypothetical protein
LLRDVYLLQVNSSPVLNDFLLTIFRTICFAGGLLLYYHLFSYLFSFRKSVKVESSPKIQKFKIFSAIIILLLFGTFVIPDFFFDRYLIQLIIPLIIVVLPFPFEFNFKNKIAVTGFSLVFIFMVFSTGLTHDYLSWNRAKWQGLNYLMTDLHKSPHLIDGGYEFNGWYETGLYRDDKIKSWWFVDQDDYLLSFGPLPGYKTLKLIPYRQYIPFKKCNMFILYKSP